MTNGQNVSKLGWAAGSAKLGWYEVLLLVLVLLITTTLAGWAALPKPPHHMAIRRFVRLGTSTSTTTPGGCPAHAGAAQPTRGLGRLGRSVPAQPVEPSQ